MKKTIQVINPMLIWESARRSEPLSIDQTDRQILHLLRVDGQIGRAHV